MLDAYSINCKEDSKLLNLCQVIHSTVLPHYNTGVELHDFRGWLAGATAKFQNPVS